MKPLYIEGGASSRLVLDGPSLQWIAAGMAPRRFPLQQLCRLVVSGSVECEAAALAACLERGITVSFLSGPGILAGIALPAGASPERLSGQMLELILTPAWRGLYDDWKRSAERGEILETLRGWGIRMADLRPAVVRRLLEAKTKELLPFLDVAAARTYAASIMASRVAQSLAPFHSEKALAAWNGLGVDCIADFATILNWRFYADLAGGKARFSPRVASQWKREITSLLESSARRDEARASRLLDRFRCWLSTVL